MMEKRRSPVIQLFENNINSVLPKGRSFTASAGIKAAFLPKSGLSPQTKEPRLYFYQGWIGAIASRCFPHYITVILYSNMVYYIYDIRLNFIYYITLHFITLYWVRRVIGISGSLIWSKILMELIFKPCGEYQLSQEGPVSQIHAPHLHDGTPEIF